MPVYEYRCSNGHYYDRTEGFDAAREHACLECGQPARRQISLPAVIFKGSGFYSTDNRKNSSHNGGAAGEDKPVETAAASTNGESKPAGERAATEGKPVAKTETKAAG